MLTPIPLICPPIPKPDSMGLQLLRNCKDQHVQWHPQVPLLVSLACSPSIPLLKPWINFPFIVCFHLSLVNSWLKFTLLVCYHLLFLFLFLISFFWTIPNENNFCFFLCRPLGCWPSSPHFLLLSVVVSWIWWIYLSICNFSQEKKKNKKQMIDPPVLCQQARIFYVQKNIT